MSSHVLSYSSNGRVRGTSISYYLEMIVQVLTACSAHLRREDEVEYTVTSKLT